MLYTKYNSLYNCMNLTVFRATPSLSYDFNWFLLDDGEVKSIFSIRQPCFDTTKIPKKITIKDFMQTIILSKVCKYRQYQLEEIRARTDEYLMTLPEKPTTLYEKIIVKDGGDLQMTQDINWGLNTNIKIVSTISKVQ